MNTEITVALITVIGSIIVALVAKIGGRRYSPDYAGHRFEPKPTAMKQQYADSLAAPRTAVQQGSIGNSFLLSWVCMCIAGWALGWTLGVLLAPESPTFGNLVSGLIVGCAQWFVLQGNLKESGWWILGTAIGGIMAGLTFAGLGFAGYSVFGFLLANVIGGISVGVAQWLVLQRQVSRSGHWILTSTAAWAIGGTIGNVVAFSGAGIVMGGLTCGLLIGVVTGSQLVLLLDQSH